MSETLHGDYETRSAVDLRATGLHPYALHPTTSPWCMSYAFDDEPVDIWVPGEPLPKRIVKHVENGGKFVGHNVAFEVAIWNGICAPRYKWPELHIEQCECTQAMAYAMGLPGALEDAAPAAGLDIVKDAAGKRLMLQMCHPRGRKLNGTYIWWDAPDKVARLIEYCKQDTEVERALHKRLVPLSDAEREIWLIDYYINARGIKIDRASILAAAEVVEAEQVRLHERMRQVTGNFVGFTSEVARLTAWIRLQGVDIPGVAKADVLDTLALEGLPEAVRQALLIRQESGRSSTAKLRKMLESASSDDRLRNLFQYHSASTGRWAARRVQPHNFPRPTFEQPQIDAAFKQRFDVAYLENFIGKPVAVIVSCLRGMLVSDVGKDLFVGDFSNVEGRDLAWLAGEEWKLQAFRDFDAGTGPDIYKLTYSKSFSVPIATVDDAKRQVGKVEELALGYGGGVGAFQTMAKGYNVVVSDERAEEIKLGWREVHPATVQYWRDVEAAAINATLSPGVFSAGPKGREVKFRKMGSFLWCRLPSGRAMCYPYPKIMQVETPWGAMKDALTYFTMVSPAAMKKVIFDKNAKGLWQRVSTYGGSLVENITQAMARDMLAEALKTLTKAGFPVVMHIHDEAVCEVSEKADDIDFKLFSGILSRVPTWAPGLPVAAKCWRGKRHRK